MLNFVSAPKNLKEVFFRRKKKKFRRKKFNQKVNLSRFSKCSNRTCLPENTRTLRNGKTFLSKPEIVTKYYLKTFDHFSKSFLNCFKLDIFEEKLVNFNIWQDFFTMRVIKGL